MDTIHGCCFAFGFGVEIDIFLFALSLFRFADLRVYGVLDSLLSPHWYLCIRESVANVQKLFLNVGYILSYYTRNTQF